jgi:hypothetical protein
MAANEEGGRFSVAARGKRYPGGGRFSRVAFDEGLAERIREQLPKATEKRMFGGAAWMERGNLVVGVHGDDLIARVGPEATDTALQEDGVRPFDITGRPMKGWVLVAQEAVAEDDELGAWIARCRTFTKTLLPK